MAARKWTLLAALLLAGAVLAGCTAPDAPDAPAPQPPAGGEPGASDPPASPPRDVKPAPAPKVEPVYDSGAIEGPFEKEWKLDVPTMGFRSADIAFTLLGAQPGAPPTARVYLAFLDPDGKEIKSAVLGLGGSGNEVTWSFPNGDMPRAGTYRIVATAQPQDDGALPSVGFANYELAAQVNY